MYISLFMVVLESMDKSSIDLAHKCYKADDAVRVTLNTSWDGRVVKASDLNGHCHPILSLGVSPRRFKSCSQRIFYHFLPEYLE